MLVILAAFSLLSVMSGAVKIPFGDVVSVLSGKAEAVQNKSFSYIIFNLRIPRTVLAITVGSALALSGVVIQALVRTTLSEPYLLGVSSGAYLGVSIYFVVAAGTGMLGKFGLSSFAFAGSLLSIVLVLVMSSINGKASMTKLILSGTIINAFFISIANFILTLYGTADGITGIKFWTMGSLAQANWENIRIPAGTTLICTIFFILTARSLNVFVQGDKAAQSLGLNTDRMRALLLIIVAILTSVIVSVSGIIGFAGLIVPHVCRMLFGTDHRKLIPVSVLTGAFFLLACDTVARTIIPNAEIPIGIITAIIGAPIFAVVLIQSKYGQREG